MVFDTETTSLDKPFCYDIGYNIFTGAGELLARQHFVIEQVWHNLPLFESAYYKEKRAQYIKLMRQHAATLTKFGYAMQAIARDIEKYDITSVYAYNSAFDDKVIAFNCDWFKCINPFESIPIYDIWAYASEWIIKNNNRYLHFCEINHYYTDNDNYKTSAEIVYKYITNNTAFEEMHMGVFDSDIEMEILLYCIEHGAQWATEYKLLRAIKRPTKTPFTIKINNNIIYQGEYIKKYIKNNTYYFTEG